MIQTMKIYIGVDPGTTGAVAIIEGPECGVYDIDNMEAMCALNNKVKNHWSNATAYVEKVNAMPKQGVSTTFKFGKATGRVIGWLEAFGIRYEEITPRKWQSIVFDSGTKTGDNKADSLNMARKLFPNMLTHLARKKDHNRADALLIAEACRRVMGNKK